MLSSRTTLSYYLRWSVVYESILRVEWLNTLIHRVLLLMHMIVIFKVQVIHCLLTRWELYLAIWFLLFFLLCISIWYLINRYNNFFRLATCTFLLILHAFGVFSDYSPPYFLLDSINGIHCFHWYLIINWIATSLWTYLLGIFLYINVLSLSPLEFYHKSLYLFNHVSNWTSQYNDQIDEYY